MTDVIGRGELARILDRAAAESVGDEADALSVAEAERIAAEVGIGADAFRAALATVRSSGLGRGSVTGPAATLVSSVRIDARALDVHIERSLAEGQAHLPQFRAEITRVADGVWRSSTRNSIVQVSSGPRGTEVVVSASRPFSKASLLSGGTALGGFIGGQLGALISTGVLGEVSSAVPLAIAAGGVSGLVAGFAAGRAAWRSMARSLQNRMILATSRIRSALTESDAGEVDREAEEREGVTGRGER